MLEAKIECIHDTAHIHYKGDTLDISEGPLVEIIDVLKRGINRILVNMEEVHYVNSSGISTFIATNRFVSRKNGRLAFYSLSPNVDKVFRLTKMENVLPCFNEEVDAARYLGIVAGDSSITKRDKIIVVENKIEIVRYMKNIFEEFKHLLMYSITEEHDLFSSYKSVLTIENVGLIILDVTLNPASTMNFLENIQTDDSLHNIPVIIATPDENIAHAHFLIRNGADDMLRFPFNKYEASARIRFALYHHDQIENNSKKTERINMEMALR